MKKVFFLMLVFVLGIAASVNAQVTIGANADPHSGAVLDLQSTTQGLKLPTVSLSSLTTFGLPVTAPSTEANAKGMFVYNTNGALGQGIYYWTGTQWTFISGPAPVIKTQPARFSFKRLLDPNGDPQGLAAAATALTVVASGDSLKYQWYRKAINNNAADVAVGTNSPTYSFTAAGTGVANWGLYKFYCVVSNNYGSVKTDIAEIALGCGAKTATGGWAKFMCYNLGVTDFSKDPFTFVANDTSILGKFYQWGSNVPVAYKDSTGFIKATVYPYDWKIPNGYNTALSGTYHQDDYAWRNHKNGDIDPCPSGWHVPAQTSFGAIFSGMADADLPANATANTWTPTGSFSWTNLSSFGNGGYAVKPDGATTTLFFPAGGDIVHSTGARVYVGQYGNYWSSDTAGAPARNIHLNYAKVYPAHIDHRSTGFNVRCIYE
jgi:uncharacterized protein (TIGR02145 family)